MSKENTSDPQSVVDETRKFWRDVAQDTVKSSVATIDETARQIIAVVAILEGLYFHAITYSDLRTNHLDMWSILAYIGPLIFWLFSLVSASLVFLPKIYRLNLASSEAARVMHEKVINKKYIFLLLSLVWMIIGSVILILALGLFLLQK